MLFRPLRATDWERPNSFGLYEAKHIPAREPRLRRSFALPRRGMSISRNIPILSMVAPGIYYAALTFAAPYLMSSTIGDHKSPLRAMDKLLLSISHYNHSSGHRELSDPLMENQQN
jgi:hypothetical protein